MFSNRPIFIHLPLSLPGGEGEFDSGCFCRTVGMTTARATFTLLRLPTAANCPPDRRSRRIQIKPLPQRPERRINPVNLRGVP